jgi:hypothetical protein
MKIQTEMTGATRLATGGAKPGPRPSTTASTRSSIAMLIAHARATPAVSWADRCRAFAIANKDKKVTRSGSRNRAPHGQLPDQRRHGLHGVAAAFDAISKM